MFKLVLLKIILILFSLNKTFSQNNEIGLMFGGTNYIGDVGPTTYINPFLKQNYTNDRPGTSGYSFGVIYKKSLSERLVLRSSARILKIKSSDYWKGTTSSRKQRGYYFSNNIEEVEMALEFNFLDFDISSNDFEFSPYVSTGISYFRFDNLFYPNNQNRAVSYGKKNDFAIPITIGLKLKPMNKFVLAFEISAHHTFTENLDGSYPKFEDSILYSQGSFGGNLSQDWYVFSGISITYIFGNCECYNP